MKIVLSSAAPDLGAAIDPRFGRAAYLLLVDTDSDEWQAFPNPALNASGGAGIKAAQYISSLQAEAVLSGEFGPNAFDALEAAGIAMYLYGDTTTIQQALERFKAGELQSTGGPTSPGHHGK